MLRSMYSGIAGMKGFQTKLDVVGNNIANVNTAGYKKSRTTFQDMLSQTSQGAQGAAGTAATDRGGINPKQVGTGSKLGSIDTVDTQGFQQNTGRGLDLMIDGNGMFVLQMGDERVFTRVGAFFLDNGADDPDNSFLTNADGYRVLDTNGDAIKISKTAKSFNITKDGKVNIVNADGTSPAPVSIALALIPNTAGLEKIGGSLYRNTSNTGYPLDAATQTLTAPGGEGAGDIVASALEMSNVDLSEEFTEMITAQRGFQANTRIITTSDEILQELVNLKR